MLRKRLIGVVFASVLTFGAFGQEVVVRVAPPHPLVEKAGGSARSRIRLDSRLSPMGRCCVCLDSRQMGIAPASPHTLGYTSLGPPAWWMGASGRALALGLPAGNQEY
jgi:hypothetical protein